MMKRLIVLLLIAELSSVVLAQRRLSPPPVDTLPSACNVGDIVNLTTGTVGDYICTAANTWNIITTGAATGAPIDATYITKTANATLTAEQAMGALATGIVKNTTTTGTQSIAVAGTDYQAPITMPGDKKLLYDNNGTIGGFGTWDPLNNSRLMVDGYLKVDGGFRQAVLGYGAGMLGSFNTMIGQEAGAALISGAQQNTAVGAFALTSANNVSARSNAAFGESALTALTTGDENVGVGSESLEGLTTGQRNTSVGMGALRQITTTSDNTAIGQDSFRFMTSGTRNVGDGNIVGESVVTGTSLVLVGYGADAATGLTNAIALGDSATATASNQAVIGNSSVTDVYFGSVSAAASLHPANVIVANGKALQTDTTTAHTALLQAYDTDTGPAYVTCGTLTNGTAPSFALSNAGGCAISITGATLVTPALGVATATSVTGRFITSGSAPTVDDTSGGNSCGAAGNPSMNGGNDNAFEFNVGAGGGTDCTVTLTAAAPNRWDCHANNETSAVLTRTVYVDTTHIKVQGVLGAADVISVMCFAR